MNVFSSFLTGLFFTALLFSICVIIVVGIKAVYNFIVSILPERKSVEPPKEQAPQSPKEQPPKKSRSIEINADEIDKIFFKKSS